MEGKEPEVPLTSSPLHSFRERWWSKETIAIVTGANRGIGYSMVKQLARLGLTVILTARDREKGIQAVKSIRKSSRDGDLLDHVYFYCLDISDPASINSFVSSFRHDFGVLDILVNNAAVSFNDIHENTVEHAETVIRTNYHGSKMLTEALVPMFRRPTTGGRILNVSSRLGSIEKLKNKQMRDMLQSEKATEETIEIVLGTFLENVKDGSWKKQGWPEIWTDYAVSKLALNAYSRILAKQNEGLGLSVNCFCPGFTQTSMTRGRGTHTADDAAVVGAMLALLPPRQLTTGIFYIGSGRTKIASKL